jgi:hypothetical protein
MYRWFGVVPQGLIVLFPVVLGGDFRSPLLVVFSVCFRNLALGDLMGGIHVNPSWFFCLWFPPNPWIKGLDFGVFGVLGLEEFLVVFLRFLLIWQVLVDKNLAMDYSWGVPTIPRVLHKSVERFGRSRFGFGGVDLRVLFIPSCPSLTGLTGVRDRSNRCRPLVGFASGELLDSCVFGSWCCWSVVGLFGVVLLGFV